jgi:hypothetical protein
MAENMQLQGGIETTFLCEDCGTQWVIPEDRTTESDPTVCIGCGGPLARSDEADLGGEGAEELGENI